MSLPSVRVAHPHVEVRDDLLSGSPCVRGTRVPVRRLWSWHRRGVSVETLLKRYPSLGPARVLDALAFAYDNADVVEADLSREQAMIGPAAQGAPESRLEKVPGSMNQEPLFKPK